MPETMDTFEDHWAHLVPHLDRLATMVERHRGGCPVAPTVENKDYMSVFTFIYNMVTDVRTFAYSQPLYDRMAQYATAYTARVVTPALATALRRGEYFKELATEWRCFVPFRKWTKAYFSYLDRFHTRGQNLPPVGTVLVRAFESAALSALLYDEALGRGPCRRAHAAVTLAFVRSRCERGIRVSPDEALGQSVQELAGREGPAWSREVTGAASLGSLERSAHAVAAALPQEPTGNPYRDFETRLLLADQVTNLEFLHRMDATIPPAPESPEVLKLADGRAPLAALLDPTPAEGERRRRLAALAEAAARDRLGRCGLLTEAVPMESLVELPHHAGAPVTARRYKARMAARYRPLQLLLLAAIHAGGEPSADPLVRAGLPLCGDLCEIVRRHLHALPTWRCEPEAFAWHVR